MTELLKKISTPTYLYVILIFLGYINYFSFYIFFDVNIINYLTFGELLLSFLNLTIPILILVLSLMLFAITARISIAMESKEILERKRQSSYYDNLEIFKGSLKHIKSTFKEKKWNSFWTYLSLIHSMFQLIVSILTYIFLLIYPFQLLMNVLGGRFIYNPGLFMMFILGFIWYAVLRDILERVYQNLESISAILYSSLLFLFIGILCLFNRKRAIPILAGNNLTRIEFIFKQQKIETNSDTLYIGQTQNFLFLRDRKKETTLIYTKDNIELIKIIKKQ